MVRSSVWYLTNDASGAQSHDVRRNRADILGLIAGKQARAADEPGRSKNEETSPNQQPAKNITARVTDPVLGSSAAAKSQQATHYEPAQPQAIDGKAKQQKRIPDENIAKLVAEENESKSKFPNYPGLERWKLVEKMGDGAFSNVYRAQDREGTVGEVAIKVVRKYEMNSMQVRQLHRGEAPSELFCFVTTGLIPFPTRPPSFSLSACPVFSLAFSVPRPLPTPAPLLESASSSRL